MVEIDLGGLVIEADRDMSSDDVKIIQAAFEMISRRYPDIAREGLAHGIFFNWMPGMDADELAASVAQQIGAPD